MSDFKMSSEPGACVGMSLIEKLEAELDSTVSILKEATENPKDWTELQISEWKGYALGTANAIALITNNSDLDSIREQAMARWARTGWRKGR